MGLISIFEFRSPSELTLFLMIEFHNPIISYLDISKHLMVSSKCQVKPIVNYWQFINQKYSSKVTRYYLTILYFRGFFPVTKLPNNSLNTNFFKPIFPLHTLRKQLFYLDHLTYLH